MLLHARSYIVYIVGLFCLSSGALALFFMLNGVPIGHDPGFYTVTYEAFKSSINDGYVMPRWLDDVNNGFGGANFYFMPPLLYYALYMLDAATLFAFDTRALLASSVVLLLFLSGLSFFECARRHMPYAVAFAGACLYMFLPYHFSTEVIDRFAIAEFAAYTFLPPIFYFLRMLSPRRKFALFGYVLSYCAIILTHLPTALLTSLFIGLYCLFHAARFQNFKAGLRYVANVIVISVLSIALCAFYLVPALSLQGLVDMDYLWRDFYGYQYWFVTYFPESDVPNKAFVLSVFYAMIFNLGLVSVCFFFLRRDENANTRFNTHLNVGLLVLTCLLMSPLLSFVWHYVVLLQAVQFPWRLMVLADFFCASAFTFILSRQNNSVQAKSMLITAVGFGLLFANISVLSQRTFDKDVFTDKQASVLAVKQSTQEHIPVSEERAKNFVEMMQEPMPAFVQSISEDVDIEVLEHKAQFIKLRLKTPEPSTIFVRQFYSPIWQIEVDGMPSSTLDMFILRDAEPYGQIAFDVPAGVHQVSLTIPVTQQERYGWMISSFGLLIFIGLLLASLFKARKKGA